MQTKICPRCAGKGFVSHRHITNKRNRKDCTTCWGAGEVIDEGILEKLPGYKSRPPRVDKPTK